MLPFCLSCTTVGNYASLEGKIYCKPHFAQVRIFLYVSVLNLNSFF